MNIETLLSKLNGVRKTANGWLCQCPAHDDSNASLSVGIGSDSKIILKCFAGCPTQLIVDKIGIKMSDLFNDEKPQPKIYAGTERKETEYKYIKNGEYQYSSVRIDTPGKQKSFVIRVGNKNGFNGVESCVYNYDLVAEAIAKGETIFIPEGEKQCDNMQKIGLIAVTNPLGAGHGKWKQAYSECFTWANVVVLPDNDEVGRVHAAEIVDGLKNITKSIRVLDLPGLPIKGDVSDWIASGGTREELLRLVSETPEYEPVQKKTNDRLLYYDNGRKEYIRQNEHGNWILNGADQFKRFLVSLGYQKKAQRGEPLSEAELLMVSLEQHNGVDYVGSLAGYNSGFYLMNDRRLLVTDSPKIITPAEGNCDIILDIVKNLFVDEEENNDTQVCYFLLWLKIAYESLASKSFRPGQVLIMAGERECGKSLLQKIITCVLGGRTAKPYKYMTGKTDFNADLFSAEHLTIEDEASLVDIKARREFGSQIKQFAANEGHRCHAKHRQAIDLMPFWRMSISLNDEPENLLILPPIDESVADKMMILRAFKKPMPMSTAKNEDRQKFWNAIESQLPAFVHYLTTLKVPEDMVSERYGIKHFHNGYISSEISRLAPEQRLLDIIDLCLFNVDEMVVTNEYQLTAYDLESKLLSDNRTRHEANKLLQHSTTCGTYLGRLAKKYPGRVKQTRQADKRLWKISRGDDDNTSR
jgi:hypothetical protein